MKEPIFLNEEEEKIFRRLHDDVCDNNIFDGDEYVSAQECLEEIARSNLPEKVKMVVGCAVWCAVGESSCGL